MSLKQLMVMFRQAGLEMRTGIQSEHAIAASSRACEGLSKAAKWFPSLHRHRALEREPLHEAQKVLGASLAKSLAEPMTMNELLTRLAREAGIDRAADLRRHDVQEALPRLAALIAEQCASAASRLVDRRAVKGRPGGPQTLSSEIAGEIAGEIRSVFPPPPEEP